MPTLSAFSELPDGTTFRIPDVPGQYVKIGPGRYAAKVGYKVGTVVGTVAIASDVSIAAGDGLRVRVIR